MSINIPLSSWSTSSDGSEVDLRDTLVQFWLFAPTDLLESLWKNNLGDLTVKHIRQLTPEYIFTDEQIAIRNQIGSFFSDNGLSAPISCNLMLANFLLSPPGLLTINNIESYFPAWLVEAYYSVYTPSGSVPTYQPPTSTELNSQSTFTTSPSADAQSSVVTQTDSFVPPALPPFPADLSLLVNDRIQLNRLLGLSNLYYIDPDDSEIKSDLIVIRRQLSDAILNCPENLLQQFWDTDLGDRYWALVRSGIQAEPLSDSDNSLKQSMVQKLNPSVGGGFGTVGSTNAFLVALMFFLPGSISIDDAESKVPSWLLPTYLELFNRPTNS